MNVIEKKYSVRDPNKVKEAFNLDSTPSGLIVKYHTEDSCTVKFVPDNIGYGEEVVSDTLLEDLLGDENEEGAIIEKPY